MKKTKKRPDENKLLKYIRYKDSDFYTNGNQSK